MRKLGYFFIIAFAPSVSLSAYLSMFFASMEKSGLSSGNGSGRVFAPGPLTKPGGGVVSPPVYSGIVPSLLPAFSAPKGVSVVPSCLASSALTAACEKAAQATVQAVTAATNSLVCVMSPVSFVLLEAGLERKCEQSAIFVEGTVVGRHDAAVVTELDPEIGILEVEGVLAQIVERQADAVGAGAFVAAAQGGGVALQAIAHENRQGKVGARKHLQPLGRDERAHAEE